MAAATGFITMEELLASQYFIALVIFLASIIFAKVFHYILKTYVKKITERTKSDLDDFLLQAATRPMYLLIIFIGAYFAIKQLSEIQPVVAVVDNAFLIIIAFTVSYLTSRILGVLITHWLHVQKTYEQTPKLINKVVSVVIFLIAILIIMAYFKVEITPLVATLGLGGLAVGLALQDTLSNFFAGLHIITDRPINVGDYIEVDGSGGTASVAGVVEDISWRSTRIRTPQNTLIIVPNAKLAGSVIMNASQQESIHGARLDYGIDAPQERGVSLAVDCGVAYGSDLKKVEKIVLEVAGKLQETATDAVRGFKPVMRFREFGESNINFYTVLRIEKYTSRFMVRHEFIKALKERFDREKIEISWPVRKVYYGKRAKTKR